MPLVYAHCDGCGKDIKEGEEDIVQVVKGKPEIQSDSMVVSWDNELWFGHAKCHAEPLQQAQQFLQGYVYQDLLNFFREDMLKGKLEALFKGNGWPTKLVE